MGQNHAENFSKPTPFFSPKCYDFHTKNRRKTALLSHFQRKTAFSRFTVALFSFYMKDHIQSPTVARGREWVPSESRTDRLREPSSFCAKV